MALSGYTRTLGRRNGGIRSIALIEAKSLSSATYTSAEGGYTAITPVSGAYFVKYDFREGEAEYREEVSLPNSSAVVTHQIEFQIDKMSCSTSELVEELTSASPLGFVALVTTTNADLYLVGYSPEFAGERPLQVLSAQGASGKTLADTTQEVLVLQSIDVSKAKSYIGSLTGLFDE